MKKIVIIALMALSIGAVSAQEALSFSKVIQTDSMSTEAVYNSVRTWFSLNTGNANKVLVQDDKSAGILIGKVNVPYSYGGMFYAAYDGYIDLTIQVSIRQGRFKVEIKNISHKKSNPKASVPDMGTITTDEKCAFGGLNKGPNQKVWNDIKEKAEALANEIFTSIEKSLKSNATSSDDNW